MLKIEISKYYCFAWKIFLFKLVIAENLYFIFTYQQKGPVKVRF